MFLFLGINLNYAYFYFTQRTQEFACECMIAFIQMYLLVLHEVRNNSVKYGILRYSVHIIQENIWQLQYYYLQCVHVLSFKIYSTGMLKKAKINYTA